MHSSIIGSSISTSSVGGESCCLERPAGVRGLSAPVVGAGSSSNTNLSNFASGTDLGVSNALNLSSGFYKILHKSFDTVELSFAVSADELTSTLDLIVPLVGAGECSFDGRRFVVSRVGGLTYRYMLKFPDGVELRLPDYGFERYGVRLKLGAKVCNIEDDVEQYAIDLVSWMLVVRRSRVFEIASLSRVDVCLDLLMPEKEFQSICRRVATADPSVVSRGREREAYNADGRFTGIRVGAGEVMLRIYDKKAEALQGKDWPFWSDLYGRGSGFDVPDGWVVARFEWQLRRGFLRSYDVRLLSEFQSVSGTVLAYLCFEWFRLAGGPSGKRHERRTVPMWRRVAAAFLDGEWSRFSPGLRRQLKRHVSANLPRLLDMAAGCLASIAAVLGHNSEHGSGLGRNEALLELAAHIREKEDWSVSVAQRYSALAYQAKSWRAVPISPVGY